MGRAPALTEVVSRLAPWGPLEVVRPLPGGRRNLVVLVRDPGGRPFVAKSTRRSEPALAWAARLQSEAALAGIAAPRLILSDDGRYAPGGMTLEPFREGRQAETVDLAVLRLPLARLRRATAAWPQRPGFASAADLLAGQRGGDVDLSALPPAVASACLAAWEPLAGRRKTAVHGDINLANLLIDEAGRPILLDWDEARRDSPLFDLSALQPVPEAVARARVAWEVAAGWLLEPAYARSLAQRLAPAAGAEAGSAAAGR